MNVKNLITAVMASLITSIVLVVFGFLGKIPDFISVPSGAVVAFNMSDCPNDQWIEFVPAQGRFVRGIDKSGTKIDPDGLRKFGSTQLDSNKIHSHRLFNQHNARNGNLVTAANFATIQETADASHDYQIKGTEHLPNMANSSKEGGHESRPKNVALLYCIKK